MQNIRTKQAEEKCSLLHFLAGSRKTVPLACRSEDWKVQREAVADFRRW